MHKTFAMLTRQARASVLVLLAACIARPAYQPPQVKIASSYAAQGETAVVRRVVDSIGTSSAGNLRPTTSSSSHYSAGVASTPFWRDLGDSTLVQLIDEAMRANTDVRVVASRVSSARASLRLAAFDLAPTITASGSTVRQRPSIAQLPGLAQQLPQQDLWDVGFDASWEVDLFGRIGRTVSAQGAFLESAERSLEDARVTLTAEVARAYFELRGAERQLAVALRNADNQRRTVGLTRDRLAAGRGNAFDTERANAELQLTLSATPVIEARIAAGRNRIAALLGRAPGDAGSVVARALADEGTLPNLPDTVRIGSPAQLVRRRPDVLSAERQFAAQSLLVGAARADYLPRLTIGASAGYAATRFDSLSRAGTARHVVGPVLSWPLLDLGRVKTRVDFASANREAAEAQYRTIVVRALEETETALVTYDRAHARLGILDEAVRACTRAAELAQQRFESGLTDFLQVLDAQRTLLSAENQLAQAHTEAATALVAVYKSVGGTWPIR